MVLALACGGDDGNDANTQDVATPTAAASTGAEGSTGSTAPNKTTPDEPQTTAEPDATASPAGDDASLGNGEAIPFQTPAGETIEAVLLSVPGPDQRIVVFTAPQAGPYREMYAGMVQEGLAVLAFDTPADGAAGAIETAVRLASSRDYPVIYIAAADAAGREALSAAANVEIDGALVIDSAAGEVQLYGADTTTPQDTAAIATPSESPEELRDVIRDFVTQ